MKPIERAVVAAAEAMNDLGIDASFHHHDALPVARAVLAAVREPTARMVVAGANETDNGDGELHSRKWRAMIDAMLEGG